MYFDFNVGLLWFIIFEDNQSFYIGGFFMYFNEFNIFFLGVDVMFLDMCFVGYMGGEFFLVKGFSLLLVVVVMSQGLYLSVMVGVNFCYINCDWWEVVIWAGGWIYFFNQLDFGVGMDVIVVIIVFEMECWNIGLSYDIIIFVLVMVNNFCGVFEVSFIYIQLACWCMNVICLKF